MTKVARRVGNLSPRTIGVIVLILTIMSLGQIAFSQVQRNHDLSAQQAKITSEQLNLSRTQTLLNGLVTGILTARNQDDVTKALKAFQKAEQALLKAQKQSAANGQGTGVTPTSAPAQPTPSTIPTPTPAPTQPKPTATRPTSKPTHAPTSAPVPTPTSPTPIIGITVPILPDGCFVLIFGEICG